MTSLEKLWYSNLLSRMDCLTFDTFTKSLTNIVGMTERFDERAVPALLELGLIARSEIANRCGLTELGAVFRTMERERVATMYRRRLGLPYETTEATGFAIIPYFQKPELFKVKCDWYEGVQSVVFSDSGELHVIHTSMTAGMIFPETYKSLDEVVRRTKEAVERLYRIVRPAAQRRTVLTERIFVD